MAEKKIKTKVIIEVIGSPKEHVENVLGKILNTIKDVKELEVIKAVSADAKEIKQFWSAFSELEIDFKEMKEIVDFCFNFMPSSIEIIEPDDILMNAKDTSDMLNDMLAGLHKYEMILKNIYAQNVLMKKEKEKASGKNETEEGK